MVTTEGQSPHLYNLFTDASFASRCDAFFSFTGIVLAFWGVPIFWKSTKQGIFAEPTCQAEFLAAAEGLACTERLGFLGFSQSDILGDDGMPSKLTLWVDSKSAQMAIAAPEPTQKTRHYALMYLKVRAHAKNQSWRTQILSHRGPEGRRTD